jgi:hypothetical protein
MPRLRRLGLAAALRAPACGQRARPIEPVLRVWDLGTTDIEVVGSWRAQLVSGSGTDLVRKAFCRADGDVRPTSGSRATASSPGPIFWRWARCAGPSATQWARAPMEGLTKIELDGGAVAGDGVLLSDPAQADSRAPPRRSRRGRCSCASTAPARRSGRGHSDGGGIERMHDATRRRGRPGGGGPCRLGGTTPAVAVVGWLPTARCAGRRSTTSASRATRGGGAGPRWSRHRRGVPASAERGVRGHAIPPGPWMRQAARSGRAATSWKVRRNRAALVSLADGSVAWWEPLRRPARRSPFVLRIGAPGPRRSARPRAARARDHRSVPRRGRRGRAAWS